MEPQKPLQSEPANARSACITFGVRETRTGHVVAASFEFLPAKAMLLRMEQSAPVGYYHLVKGLSIDGPWDKTCRGCGKVALPLWKARCTTCQALAMIKMEVQ